MPKLYFRYGTMGSAKTLNLLAVAHNYKAQGKKVCVIKPLLDTRFGQSKVVSRAGLDCEADILVTDEMESTLVEDIKQRQVNCVLADEVQFFSEKIIERLRSITQYAPVICYGLRTDFQSNFFPGSKRLMELADSIEELKVTCQFCNRKAIFNMRFKNKKPTFSGEQIELGAEETYSPVCYACWELAKNNQK